MKQRSRNAKSSLLREARLGSVFTTETKTIDMTRSRFMGMFGATAASAVAATRLPDEVAEDAAICAFAAEIVARYASGDFRAVAQRMHPEGLKLVYDSTCTGYERLVERFGATRVHEVSGLADHPGTLASDHTTFYVRLMELTQLRHPGFTATPGDSELKIIGGIVDPQHYYTFAHILYDHRGSLKSKQSEVKFLRPSSLTLVHDARRWMCWSAIGGNKPIGFWYSDLEPKSEDEKPSAK